MTPCLTRVVVPSTWPYVATQRVICMPPDGVLLFEFHINVD